MPGLSIPVVRSLRQRLACIIGAGDSLHSQLIRGVLGTGGVRVAAQLLALISSVLLARLLGVEGYGIYGFTMAVVGLLAIPVNLGLPQFIVRQCAIYRGRDDLSSMKGLLIRANQVVITSAVIIGAGSAFIVENWVSSAGAVAPQVLLFAFPLLPLIALNGIRSAALRGLGRVVLGQTPELLLRPLIFIMLLGIAVVVSQNLKPTQAILINVAAMAAAFVFGAWMLHSSLPSGFKRADAKFSERQWLAGSWPFLALGGAHVLMQQTDVLMLGILANAEDVGIYRAVSQAAMLVVFGFFAVNTVIAPYLARLHDAKDEANLQRIITLAAQGAFLMAMLFVFVYIVAGDRLLMFVFGEAFSGGYLALVILAAGWLGHVGMGAAGMILNMTGYAWYSAAGVLVAGVLNVALNVILIPFFGLEGAALATAVSLMVHNVLLAYWVFRFTDLVSIVVRWAY